MFNWIDFLEKYEVFYRTSGPNCAANHCVIKCPFCGDSDPSEHMGLDLKTGYWGCWRNDEHRGKSPVKLVMKLLECSRMQAERIVGYTSGADATNFEQFIQSLSNENIHDSSAKTQNSAKVLEFPKEFKSLASSKNGLADKFINYLSTRGFRGYETKVAERYNIHYCLTGKWKDRLILPIYDERDRLACWTGRSVHPQATLRYMSLSEDEEKEEIPALMNIKQVVYNFQNAMQVENSNNVYIVEGPFDAIKLDFFGHKHGTSAIALFNMNTSKDQELMVSMLRRTYHNVYVMLDSGAEMQTMKAASQLSPYIDQIKILPPNVKDPGELTKDQIQNFLT